eukprot:2081844-Rhodomonas_salina.1
MLLLCHVRYSHSVGCDDRPLRARFAMPGTDVGNATASYAMSGTHIAYATHRPTRCLVLTYSILLPGEPNSGRVIDECGVC